MAITTQGFDFGRGLLGEARQFSALEQQQQQLQQQRFAQQQLEQQVQRQEQIRQLLGQAAQPQEAISPEAAIGGVMAPPEEIPEQLTQQELIEEAQQIDPGEAQRQLKVMGLDDPSRRAEASRSAAQIMSVPFSQREQAIMARVNELQSQGRDPSDTMQLLEMNEAQQNQALTGIQLLDLSTRERLSLTEKRGRAAEAPAGQREFEALTKGLTEEERKKAALIKLGLSPRAVGSAIQTISEENLAEEIGKTEAIIAQRKKFAELTGASRAKAIDKGFERITKIDSGIRNLDRAIEAIDAGASTGVLQTFSPSIRASSVALDQVRNTLALDVLNSATFGALSEKELELTKETALPTKLRPAELRQWVLDRKVAEEKLKAYFQEQINHLDQGGTVASFLRMKEREQEGTQPTAPIVGEQQPTAQQVIRFDEQGNII